MLPRVLANTAKDYIRMCDLCILELFAPCSFRGTQGTLAVCRISLAQTEESSVPLSLDPRRQTSEPSECPAW